MADGSDADLQDLELLVERHRSFGAMAIVAGRLPGGGACQVLFQEAPGRCSQEDMEALKKLPTSRALHLGSQDFRLTVRVVLKEANNEKKGPPVYHAGGLLNLASCERDLGEMRCKDQRHEIFAHFVASEFGRSQGYVLEVAGGKGALAEAMRARGLQVVMVEPRAAPVEAEVETETEGSGSEVSELEDHAPVRRICAAFDATSMALVAEAWALVAMHPDEATDAVVDAALAAQKPFAVVPCCVFPRLFHQRRLWNGGGVTGYTGLLRFLREKDVRMRAARLPFTGRNIVLYMTAEDFCKEKQGDVGPLRAPNWRR